MGVPGYFYMLTNHKRKLLYAGATKDLRKRLVLHKTGYGARFPKRYGVDVLVYYEKFPDVHDAFLREKQIKNWHKEWKWNLIKTKNPNLEELSDFID
ncbi:GIY-YIG nuclease family protein [Dokdonia sinensis]|uniref:GIY-YIG nuclease family protein n=2 Tax=Dokdonia sinensis TaxID=2479847 RepID=A0A3M0GPN2_9FLAO|nr:GIY-YIG nuclease family protein [Dokdonia sinensis]